MEFSLRYYFVLTVPNKNLTTERKFLLSFRLAMSNKLVGSEIWNFVGRKVIEMSTYFV